MLLHAQQQQRGQLHLRGEMQLTLGMAALSTHLSLAAPSVGTPFQAPSALAGFARGSSSGMQQQQQQHTTNRQGNMRGLTRGIQ
jgi:hypothetical protein